MASIKIMSFRNVTLCSLMGTFILEQPAAAIFETEESSLELLDPVY